VCHQEGFLSCREAIEGIQDAKLGTFLPKVKARDIVRLRETRQMVVVDARNAEDYQAGHIEGSISIPAHWTVDRCRQALSGVSKADQIVIYCQSNGCPFGEILARKLLACGFENLVLFPGGWLEWQQEQGDSRK
jgi:rhodanese-related sulfurtransferase